MKDILVTPKRADDVVHAMLPPKQIDELKKKGSQLLKKSTSFKNAKYGNSDVTQDSKAYFTTLVTAPRTCER